jgi:hypothetical protein
MWDPQRLITLWASMAWYRDSFTFYRLQVKAYLFWSNRYSQSLSPDGDRIQCQKHSVLNKKQDDVQKHNNWMFTVCIHEYRVACCLRCLQIKMKRLPSHKQIFGAPYTTYIQNLVVLHSVCAFCTCLCDGNISIFVREYPTDESVQN